MHRVRQRLVALVSLTTFLVGNTHAGTAIAAHLLAPRPAASSAPHQNSAGRDTQAAPKAKKPTRSCCRCARHKKPAPETPAPPRPEKQGPCAPACPDCPKGPCGPQCPCPGGCALCGVAQVPCLSPFAPFTVAPPCLGDSLIEPTPLYVPPHGIELLRPPRA
jgi:hypothetical protein